MRAAAVPGRTLAYGLLGVILLFCLLPLVYALAGSLKSNLEILAGGTRLFPRQFHFENYTRAWVLANFSLYTWNSVYMTVIRVAAAILTSSMAAYVFVRGSLRGRKIILAVLTSTMFVSLGTVHFFPLLQIAKALGIHRGLWGVIIIRCLSVNAPYIYLVMGYLRTIPHELEQAAQIDGCSYFQVFRLVTAPLMVPMLATVGLLEFMASWNDFLFPMVFTLSNPEQAPLTVGIVMLKNTGRASGAWDLMLAGTMISIIPMIVVYLFFNRFFITGLTSGALKG
jgi:multiple sugar transport system permease protein